MDTNSLPISSPPPIAYCVRCNDSFADYEDIACTGPDEYWHMKCFVCAQCFRPFGKDLEYYDFNGQKYCERDFRVMFAPYCSRCDQDIIGRFIRALGKCWHPNCFVCDSCHRPLKDVGFIRSQDNRALCHTCDMLEESKNIEKAMR